MYISRYRTIALLLGLSLVATACGGENGADDTTTSISAETTTVAPVSTTAPPPTAAETTTTLAETTTAAPSGTVFVGADGVEQTITDTSRIVTLTGDLTEIVYELGLGDRVVAVDVTTTYPEQAAALPVIGFAQQLAPESILAFEPTLILADQTVGPPEAIEQLRGVGIPVVVLETQTTLDGVATKITQVAEILGETEAGAALASEVASEIAETTDAVERGSGPRVAYVYVRGPQTLLLFGAGMPTQAIIEGVGAIDTAAETGVFGAAPLTPEALVAAAPDVIVLPEAGLEALGGVEAFKAIPGVAETPAGATDRFLAYDEAFFFNLGPRTGDALAAFASDLSSLGTS